MHAARKLLVASLVIGGTTAMTTTPARATAALGVTVTPSVSPDATSVTVCPGASASGTPIAFETVTTITGYEQGSETETNGPAGAVAQFHPLAKAARNGCAGVALVSGSSTVHLEFTVTAVVAEIAGGGALTCTGSATRVGTSVTGALSWVVVNPCG